MLNEAAKISENELDSVAGGRIFNATGISGSDPQRPYEVIDNHNGNVLGRFGSRIDAEDWTHDKYGWDPQNTADISWNELQALRRR